MAFATKPVNTWSVDDVCEFLGNLELGHTIPKFKENGVNGSDLTSLSDEDFTTELGLTKLQHRKIKTGLESLAGCNATLHGVDRVDSAPDTTGRLEADQYHQQQLQPKSQPTVSLLAIQQHHLLLLLLRLLQATQAPLQATQPPAPTPLPVPPCLVRPCTPPVAARGAPQPAQRSVPRPPSCCSSRSGCSSSRSSLSRAPKRPLAA